MEADIREDIENYRKDVANGMAVECVNGLSDLPCLRVWILRSTYEKVRKWAGIVRELRSERDANRNDSGSSRENEEIIGKLAEVACVALQDKMPLAAERGGFEIDLDFYQKGGVAFDSDLAPGVGVKTHVDNNHELSWLIDRKDPMMNAPASDDAILLCKAEQCSGGHYACHIDILGFVMAKDMARRGLWFRTKYIAHKMAIYFNDGEIINCRPPGFYVVGMADAIIPPTSQYPHERRS